MCVNLYTAINLLDCVLWLNETIISCKTVILMSVDAPSDYNYYYNYLLHSCGPVECRHLHAELECSKPLIRARDAVENRCHPNYCVLPALPVITVVCSKSNDLIVSSLNLFVKAHPNVSAFKTVETFCSCYGNGTSRMPRSLFAFPWHMRYLCPALRSPVFSRE